jgi:hypothetical protein
MEDVPLIQYFTDGFKIFLSMLLSVKISALSGCSVMANSKDVSWLIAGKKGLIVALDPR